MLVQVLDGLTQLFNFCIHLLNNWQLSFSHFIIGRNFCIQLQNKYSYENRKLQNQYSLKPHSQITTPKSFSTNTWEILSSNSLRCSSRRVKSSAIGLKRFIFVSLRFEKRKKDNLTKWEWLITVVLKEIHNVIDLNDSSMLVQHIKSQLVSSSYHVKKQWESMKKVNWFKRVE